MPPSIAIIGAGPGGLTLARLLLQSSIPTTIFELRHAPDPFLPQPPSGSLDLHEDSGLRAIRVCGLHDAFLKLVREGSEDTQVTDKEGTILYSDSGNPDESRPEIDRSALTDLLLSSLPAHTINWSHKVTSISPSPSGSKWTINFASSSHNSQTFDLVIGADGAWSRVAPALTDVKPYYSTINCIILTITSLSTSFPHLASLIGAGSVFSCAPGAALVTQRSSSNDTARIYALLSSSSATFLSTATSTSPGLASLLPSALKHELISNPAYFGTWGADLRALIAAASEEPICYFEPKPMYMLPIGHRWKPREGVTLLGDAAHLMTPFSGEGVNAAMLDAVELAEEMVGAWRAVSVVDRGNGGHGEEVWRGLTARYEVGMLDRAEENAKGTWEGLQAIFGEDSPMSLVRVMESHGPPPEGENGVEHH